MRRKASLQAFSDRPALPIPPPGLGAWCGLTVDHSSWPSLRGDSRLKSPGNHPQNSLSVDAEGGIGVFTHIPTAVAAVIGMLVRPDVAIVHATRQPFAVERDVTRRGQCAEEAG